MSSNPLLGNYDITGQRRLVANPLFHVLRSFVPERMKEVFLLCDFLVYNCEQAIAALKKFSEYPVTDFSFDANTSTLNKLYEELFTTTLDAKRTSIVCGFDLQLYGNSFVSLYLPFDRFLKCEGCGYQVNIRKVDYTFESTSFQFKRVCERCDANHFKIVDKPVKNPEKLRIIRWDPKSISIDYEFISGLSEYYLKIPSQTVDKVMRGDKHTLARLPLSILDTIKAQSKRTDGKTILFKFKDGELYHMKVPAPAGLNYGWGIPPIMAALNAIYYVNSLRKSNEAIAMERMVSFRVMHPDQRTTTTEPAARINLQTWVENTKRNYEKFRVDQNHVMFSPVPVGVTEVGGNGKLLLSIGELEAAETNILLAWGIPREFVYGGLNNLGGSITLRNLENQLVNHTAEIRNLNQWVANRAAKFLGWHEVKVSMTPFKLIDDVQQKGADLALFQAGAMSKRTILKVHNHDYDEELEQLKKEAVDSHKMEIEMQEQVNELNNTLQTQVNQAVGGPVPGSPEQVMADAQGILQQLTQMDEGQRRQVLAQIQSEDYVLYAVVAKMLEEQVDGDSVYADPGLPDPTAE